MGVDDPMPLGKSGGSHLLGFGKAKPSLGTITPFPPSKDGKSNRWLGSTPIRLPANFRASLIKTGFVPVSFGKVLGV